MGSNVMMYSKWAGGAAVFLLAAELAVAGGDTGVVAADHCLAWKVETVASDQASSSCSFYNRDKVSTRFLVRNHCDTEVSGVFTYYKNEAGQRPILNMRPFAVKPGHVVEVAKPCGVDVNKTVEVSQVSFNQAV